MRSLCGPLYGGVVGLSNAVIPAVKRTAPALAVWVAAWLLMLTLDGSADLANLALVLVLASAVSGLWLSAVESVCVCALTVLAFNWQFVPPRGTFTVDLRQHFWLLLTMLAVGSMVAWLTARQRLQAQAARAAAAQAEMLRSFGEQIRGEPRTLVVAQLATALQQLTQAQVCIAWQESGADSHAPHVVVGSATSEERAHLRECLRTAQGAPLALPDVHGYQSLTLPLAGQVGCLGAALLRLPAGHVLAASARSTAQALCNQTALHCERMEVEMQSRSAQQEAQTQKVRNTLLAAISHDYRTPLATILGAASSLLAQSQRLSAQQARALAQTVVDEVQSLSTMTDNTLQLARLDASGVQIRRDWESLEELIGSATARARSRYPDARINLRIAAGLPLLRCDAALIVQLLNNLVDNAVKYGQAAQTIEIIARPLDQQVLLAVADRGPGIASAERDRLFLPFERGDGGSRAPDAVRGAGLGLALCRAIVQAHGGTLQARNRQRGGTSMECRFALQAQPDQPEAEGGVACA